MVMGLADIRAGRRSELSKLKDDPTASDLFISKDVLELPTEPSDSTVG